MRMPGLYSAHLLAASVDGSGKDGANHFLSSPAGTALEAVCGAIAIVIVVISVLKMINGIGRGRPGEAFKSLVFGLVIGALLFNLSLTIDGVSAMAKVAGKVIDSFSSIASN